MKLFALSASRDFGQAVAQSLGQELAAHEERTFEDDEHKSRPLESVRDLDVYVIQSLHGGPDESGADKLCRLLFFIGALRENGAARITAITPYLAYSRKDRQTKPRDPVTTRYMAQLLETMGTDMLMTLEVHNLVALQNAFRIPTVHLDTRRLFADYLGPDLADGPVVVASPDPGGIKRAQLFRETLAARLGRDIGFAFLEKRRKSGVVTGDLLAGEVTNATVLVLDDMISTGGTMVRAAKTCLTAGAARVFALAGHGLFTPGADAAMADPHLSRVIVTDAVPPFRLAPEVRGRVEVVSVAPLFAEAIRRLNQGGSLAELMQD